MRKPLSPALLVALGVVLFILIAYAVKTWQIGDVLKKVYPVLDGGLYSETVSLNGLEYLVPPNEVYNSGLSSENIPSLNDPKFVSVAEADGYIADDLPGISVEVGDDHRFYPIQVLAWHIVVNDTVGGQNLLVSYDPLTGTARVFDRGDKTFAVSGKIYNNNTLLTAGDDSLWSQALGTTLAAYDRNFEALEPYASEMVLWGTWKAHHPSAVALSKETGYERDYTHHPYGGYMTSEGIYFPLNHTDSRLSAKWIVYGVGNVNDAVVFAKDILFGKGAMNDEIDGQPIVALYDFDQKIGRVFMRNVVQAEGTDEATAQVLTFAYDYNRKRLTDNETGSVWSADGMCTSGVLKGMQLDPVIAPESFFFSWASYYPQTRISGVEIFEPSVEEAPNETP